MNLYYVTTLCFTGRNDQPVCITLSERERILTEDEIDLRMVERLELYRCYSHQLYSSGFDADTKGEIVETTFSTLDNSTKMVKQIFCRVV